MTKRNEQRAVAALLLVALIVRLAWVLKLAPNTVFGDQDEYIGGATRLLRGEPLARLNDMYFVRAPGQSLFIALVWRLIGRESLVTVRVAQAFVSTATCLYVWLLAHRLSRRSWAALVALAMAVFYPYFVFYTSSLGTECVFAFFVAAGMYHLAVGLETTPRYGQLVIASVLLALGNLLRPNLSTFLPALGLWLVWRERRRLVRIVPIGLALALPILLVTLPWVLSIHRQGLGWVWVTDGGSIWYFMGHNDETLKLYCADLTPDERRALVRFPESEAFSNLPVFKESASAPTGQHQAAFTRTALAWDRAHLADQPCLAWHKLTGYWRPYVNPDSYPMKTVLVSLAAVPVLALGLWGVLVALWRRQGGALPILTALNALIGTAVAMLFSTEIRYRIPVVDVLLVAFVGYGLSALSSPRRQVADEGLDSAA